jgi:hypothetical protein
MVMETGDLLAAVIALHRPTFSMLTTSTDAAMGAQIRHLLVTIVTLDRGIKFTHRGLGKKMANTSPWSVDASVVPSKWNQRLETGHGTRVKTTCLRSQSLSLFPGMTLFLFDFDGTLLPFHGKLPRQTRHALRQLVRLHHTLGVVTNNIVAPTMLQELGIPVANIVVQRGSEESREHLVARWFALFGEQSAFYYFDDREEQARAVKKAFPETCSEAFHVNDPQKLYLTLRPLCHQ